MKRKDFTPTAASRLCSAHFSPHCFEHNLALRATLGVQFKPQKLRLKPDAVPTIFNFEMKSVKQGSIEESSRKRSSNTECRRAAFGKHRKLEVLKVAVKLLLDCSPIGVGLYFIISSLSLTLHKLMHKIQLSNVAHLSTFTEVYVLTHVNQYQCNGAVDVSLVKFSLSSSILSALSDQLLDTADLKTKLIIYSRDCTNIQRESERQKVAFINKPTDEDNKPVACMFFTYNYTK